MYKYLFSPIHINKLEIKNRIAYPGLALLYSYDGNLNDRYYNYFQEKARGGAGIVTVGPVGVDFLGAGAAALSLANDDAIPSFQKLSSIIKKGGARAWVQLHHGGAYSLPIFIGGAKPIAPSAVYSAFSKTIPRKMTIDEIKQTQNAFVRSALRAKEAGFDGVEILASAGYLITQFLSKLKNKRTDEYGGSFENRARFARELIVCARSALGDDYPLSIRMAGNDFVPGSNSSAQTSEIAKVYENAGVDAINVTGGWHESKVPQLPMDLPRSAFAYLALNIKKAVTIPVMASNRITTPNDAEKIIRDGCADMVNLGRVLIADPYWPEKALQGKHHEIRPCVGCSQGCMDQIFSGQPLFCIANPQAGFEQERIITKASIPKQVMVVGAGVAGLEAAVTAARAGHHVELYEKETNIGGQLWLAAAPPHKQELLDFIRYYRAMLHKYDISLHLNTDVDLDFIKATNPDFLIVAEGAQCAVPPIEGADDARVMSAWHVLLDNPFVGKNVAIIGGGSVGLETALFVAGKGTISPDILHFLFTYDAESVEKLRELMFQGTSRVTVFEMLPKVGADIGKSTKWMVLNNLKKFGVKIIADAKVSKIEHGKIFYEQNGMREQLQFDNVIVATGSISVQRLSSDVSRLGIPMATIGDCICPGKINDAIHGGFLAALQIK